MRSKHLFPAVAVVLLLVSFRPAGARPAEVEAYFSPNGCCAQAACQVLDNAKRSILAVLYSISEPSITHALLNAHSRGIPIKIIVSKTQTNDKYSSAPKLHHAGIRVVCDRVEALQHNKVFIIDNFIVITGSYNFSRAAEYRNAENMVIIRDKQIANAFTNNWRFHYNHSSPYHITHSRDYHPPRIPSHLITPLHPRPQKEPH